MTDNIAMQTVVTGPDTSDCSGGDTPCQGDEENEPGGTGCFGDAYSDALDQANLTLPLSPVTANITIKLATDCFGYKGPAQ
jgi:hypothetical protein